MTFSARAMRLLMIPFLLSGPSEVLAEMKRRRLPLKGGRIQKAPVQAAPRSTSSSSPYRTRPASAVRLAPNDDRIPRLSLGAAYTGVQVRTRVGKRLGLEARYMWNKAASDLGDVDAKVAGGRIYLFSDATSHGFTFFGGAEGASLASSTEDNNLDYKGLFVGGFAGLEYRISRRFSWGMDAGYYQLTARSSSSRLEDMGSGLVLNSYLNFHIF